MTFFKDKIAMLTGTAIQDDETFKSEGGFIPERDQYYFQMQQGENVFLVGSKELLICLRLLEKISHIIFQMDEVARGNFVSNAEELLMYVLRKQDPRYNDIRKIAVKIYDHAQLVTYQVENIQDMFNSGIDDAKLDLEKTIQGVEKEYVSILGIFASIILAFVGGMTFSTSVLNNIAKASIFRLLIVTDLLAFVLFNTIIILLKFIFVINDSRQNFPFSAKFMNIILLIFALFILISWCFSLNDIPSFLLKFFPWGH